MMWLSRGKGIMKKEGSFQISFEFFPPKTEESKNRLLLEVSHLVPMHPHFFSVTYGAGGSTQEGTVKTIQALQQHTAVAAAPHLSCIGLKRAQLIEILKTYQSLGVKRIVALRGDRPSGMKQVGELHFAYELVALIREVIGEDCHLSVAAYPEYHPEAKNVEEDILNLCRKVEAGANSAITQYFYNSDAYAYFLDHCAKAGISIPIIPGIMPITSFGKLARFSTVCGAEIPKWLHKRLEHYQDDLESVQAFGIEVVVHLCERLMSYGAPGFHFYTLNQAEPTCAIIKKLSLPSHFIVLEKQERKVV